MRAGPGGWAGPVQLLGRSDSRPELARAHATRLRGEGGRGGGGGGGGGAATAVAAAAAIPSLRAASG
jgi:hypothetical protein